MGRRAPVAGFVFGGDAGREADFEGGEGTRE